MTFLVKATQVGFYGDSKKQPGEKFGLDSELDFEKSWMSKVSGFDQQEPKLSNPEESSDDLEEDDSDEVKTLKPLHQMSVKELLEIAEEKGLELDPTLSRGQMVKIIKAQK